MNRSELRGLGRLAAGALGATTTRVQEMHRAVADRAYGLAGPLGAPAHVVHDAIATGVYATVRAGLRTTSRAVFAEVARRADPEAPSVTEAPLGAWATGWLNGGIGDVLERDVPELATVMGARVGDGDVTGRIAVFVHGLGETERCWSYGALRHWGTAGETYGSRLRRDLGYTPVWVRYNTGRRISDNGRDLGLLVGDLLETWPVEVTDIVLIGHSMGGLVARSALRQGGSWAERVTSTVTLGAPHLGAPLERAAHLATRTLNRFDETRALGVIAATRSAGIKDLGHGALLEDDWTGRDPDAWAGPPIRFPLAGGGRHFAVVAGLAGGPGSPGGRLLGDAMVSARSAAGDTGGPDRLAFPPGHVAHVRGLHHMDLVNHARVYPHLRRWLTAEHPRDAAP